MICINNVQTPAGFQRDSLYTVFQKKTHDYVFDSLYEAVYPGHCWDSFSHSRPIGASRAATATGLSVG